jgi:hypothetical protein
VAGYLRWVILKDSSKWGVPMRDHWEYKMLVGSSVGFPGVTPHWVDVDDTTDYGTTLSTELLNRLGQDGWEVCAFDVSLASRTLLLKRKKV